MSQYQGTQMGISQRQAHEFKGHAVIGGHSPGRKVMHFQSEMVVTVAKEKRHYYLHD